MMAAPQVKMNTIITTKIKPGEKLAESQELTEPAVLPLMPMRDNVLFPDMPMAARIERDKTRRLMREVTEGESIIAVVCQRDPKVDEPALGDLCGVGCYARVIKMIEMPDDSLTVILHGIGACSLDDIVAAEPFLKAAITPLHDNPIPKHDAEFGALLQSIADVTKHILELMGEGSREIAMSISNLKDPVMLIDFLAMNIGIDTSSKQAMLEQRDIKRRAYLLFASLQQESQLLDIKNNIRMRTHQDLSQQQREHFLHQQMKAIQEELGNDGNDTETLRERFKTRRDEMPEGAIEAFERELRKLERLNPQLPDYSVQYNYLEQMLALPWNKFSKDNFDLRHARRRLDRDHYGLDKVKERIIEHLAVLSLRGDFKAPILCLAGPPGVGKTSLGQSIAAALGRKYARISLGGLHDEAEIRGHRRTYVGAMMGRVLDAVTRCGTSNPVIVLDEIDKVGADYKGDPQSALLEVLDPEQNSHFHDNYIDVDYDLSRVMFIATANDLSTVSRPLLDRMEVIELNSYILEEKVEIAKRHLVPKQLKEHGLQRGEVRFTDAAIRDVVTGYTHEAGVRRLEKNIATVLRKVTMHKVMGDDVPTSIRPAMLQEFLGPVRFLQDRYEGNNVVGVVTGLAWTAVGGEILYVESSLAAGKGEKLTLTGNLGDVMKESAVIALQYLRSHADHLGIAIDDFDRYNVHIHVPEGAIPKDGPSAGVTMVTSLASSFLQQRVKPRLAMTGEITLRGKVLPVGGISEKILAAKRAGITDIIMCAANRKDVEDIKPEYIAGLTFHYVDTIDEVLNLALEPK